MNSGGLCLMLSAIFRGFLIKYAIVALPVVAALVFYAVSLISAAHKAEIEDQAHQVTALRAEILTLLNSAKSDVIILEQSQEIKSFLHKPTLINEAIVQYRLRNFMLSKGIYDQLRLLDLNGREIVRVNRKGQDAVAVLKNDLQDKSNRYYFRSVKDLAIGEVFVSRLDLNIENGQIETPWKLMIRIATPFEDRFGRKAGVLVANLNATSLLNEFEILFNGDSSALRMMNDEGYWVFHPNASKSFGFMTGIENSMIENDLNVWNVMISSQRGMVDSITGHYVYDTIILADEASMRFALDEDIDRWWKVIAFKPYQSMMSDIFEHFGWMVLFVPVFLLVSGLLSWSWAKSSHMHQQARVAEKRLVNVIEQSSELVMITDARAQIEYVNPAFEKVSGYSKDELIGENSRIVRSGKQDHAFYVRMWETLKNGQDFSGVFINKRKDGSFYCEHKQITPVLNEAGKIIQFLSLGKDVTEQKKLESLAEQMREFAFKDALTGVHNRVSMVDLMMKAMLRTKRDDTLMLIDFIDIDNFKKINDEHGHEMGDRCIKHVAEMLILNTRETDTVFRLGGDEFVIMLEGFSHVDEVHTVLRKILEGMVATPEMHRRGISLRISIGAMIFPFGDVHEVDGMISEADSAMYQSKLSGGHTYTFYEPWMKEGGARQTRLNSEHGHPFRGRDDREKTEFSTDLRKRSSFLCWDSK